jgi:L-seryl-tRNA(Ser) seleniumtransferase
VDKILRTPAFGPLIDRFGRSATTAALRAELAALRATLGTAKTKAVDVDTESVARRVEAALIEPMRPSLCRVFNLTGTLLHTNLGRAQLAREAVEAVAVAAAEPSNLEFELAKGRRGERDDHLEPWLTRLTGAEAATVVNNNAAALLIVLNTLALRKQVPVSRGELIEIGGSFRLPEIMIRAGCRLYEVGTTNRTHLKDFAEAIGKRTGLILKVHTSNYAIQGFTASVPEDELAALAHRHNLPFIVDLGSGTLVNLARYGLAHEPTPTESLRHGADLVTFSGDKLLGGPQAGIIVGRKVLIEKIRRNPLKRALRLDKMTIAALSATLRLYADPDRLAERLPTLRMLTRPVAELEAMARRLEPVLAASLGDSAIVDTAPCQSQVGSGALPVYTIPSLALRLRPPSGWRGASTALARLTVYLRGLPVPVIGRIVRGALWLDLRGLTDEAAFAAQLARAPAAREDGR